MFEPLQSTSYGVSFAFWALSTISTGLRTYSRGWIIQDFGWDDWWTDNLSHGGEHSTTSILFYISPTPDPARTVLLSKMLFAEILYIWMQFAIKQAFLLFYLRLTKQTFFIYSVYATMALNIAIAVALWLFYCLQCQPLAAFWNKMAYPDAKCLNTAITYYVPVAFNILTDFIILFLPIRPLWALQASLTRRLGVIAVVSVGGVAVVVSCLRIIVLHQFAINPDFTYVLGQMVIISAVELNIAIMAANVPSFKAIWLKHVSGSLSEYKSSVQLSSLNRRKQSGAVVYQRSVPKREQDIPDSSSTNYLVGRSESRDSVNYAGYTSIS